MARSMIWSKMARHNNVVSRRFLFILIAVFGLFDSGSNSLALQPPVNPWPTENIIVCFEPFEGTDPYASERPRWVKETIESSLGRLSRLNFIWLACPDDGVFLVPFLRVRFDDDCPEGRVGSTDYVGFVPGYGNRVTLCVYRRGTNSVASEYATKTQARHEFLHALGYGHNYDYSPSIMNEGGGDARLEPLDVVHFRRDFGWKWSRSLVDLAGRCLTGWDFILPPEVFNCTGVGNQVWNFENGFFGGWRWIRSALNTDYCFISGPDGGTRFVQCERQTGYSFWNLQGDAVRFKGLGEMCVTVTSWPPKSGTELIMADCAGGLAEHQMWTIEIAEDTVRFQVQTSRAVLFIGVPEFPVEGQTVTLSHAAEEFHRNPSGALTTPDGRMCLNVQNYSLAAQKSKLVFSQCIRGPYNIREARVQSEYGWYVSGQLENGGPGLSSSPQCLDLGSMESFNGQRPWTYPCGAIPTLSDWIYLGWHGADAFLYDFVYQYWEYHF